MTGRASKKFRAIICVLFRHSNIVTNCFGYKYCGRCGVLVGDSLGGVYANPDAVMVGHDCQTCFDNYARMTWVDWWLAPHPFTSAHPLTQDEIKARRDAIIKRAKATLAAAIEKRNLEMAERP